MDSSWVDDYYAGDVFAAFEEAQNHRDALFLFYAPWDVDSQRAREAVEAAADAFEDHSGLYFAAVNCWAAEGECYREFGAGKQQEQGKPRESPIQKVTVPLLKK